MSKERIITLGDLFNEVFGGVLKFQPSETKDDCAEAPIENPVDDGRCCCGDTCCCESGDECECECKCTDESDEITLPLAYTAIQGGEGIGDMIKDIYDIGVIMLDKMENPDNVLVDVVGDGHDFMIVSLDTFDNVISKVSKTPFTTVVFDEVCEDEEDEDEIIPFYMEQYSPYLIRDTDIEDEWGLIVYNTVSVRPNGTYYMDVFVGEVNFGGTLEIIPFNDNTKHLLGTDGDLEGFDYLLLPPK